MIDDIRCGQFQIELGVIWTKISYKGRLSVAKGFKYERSIKIKLLTCYYYVGNFLQIPDRLIN